jgi:phage shock protein A
VALPEEPPAGEQAYFRLPQQPWATIWPAVEERLRATSERLEQVLDEQARDAEAPSPAELALDLGAAATALFTLLAPEERDLREIVSTLRTALALCWDMYSYQEAGKVSVQSHMDRLRTEIEGFEAQLGQMQAEQQAPEGEG